MTRIIYKIGDATSPQAEGMKVIAHVCNNENKWGSGFVIALSKKWQKPEEYYRYEQPRVLGNVGYVSVEEDIVIANMIAQDGINPKLKKGKENPPIKYDALVDCLLQLNRFCEKNNATLHMPRIGSDRAGGNWIAIEALIQEFIHIPVYVYDLEARKNVYYAGKHDIIPNF